MNAYPECYVNEIVETQGKLFELVSDSPSIDFDDFIERYMTGKTRTYLDRKQGLYFYVFCFTSP